MIHQLYLFRCLGTWLSNFLWTCSILPGTTMHRVTQWTLALWPRTCQWWTILIFRRTILCVHILNHCRLQIVQCTVYQICIRSSPWLCHVHKCIHPRSTSLDIVWTVAHCCRTIFRHLHLMIWLADSFLTLLQFCVEFRAFVSSSFRTFCVQTVSVVDNTWHSPIGQAPVQCLPSVCVFNPHTLSSDFPHVVTFLLCCMLPTKFIAKITNMKYWTPK